MSRHELSGLLALFLLAVHAASQAQTQDYPNRPIRMVIPFVAGGFSDIVGRIVGQKLSEGIGQSVVIDNRPGASGIIGTNILVKAQPDGYTLMLSSFNHVVNPSLMKLPYDPIDDFAEIGLVAEGPPLVTLVSAGSPVKTIKELVELAKSRPGKLNYGSSGIGTSGHLIGELLKLETGIDMVHVAYRGSNLTIPAVIAGEVFMLTTYMTSALPQVKAGKLRALAVTSARRSAVLPDVPTMAESGVSGVVVSGFAGMLAPADTPAAIVKRLQGEVAKMAKNPDFVKQLAAYDMTPVAGTPEELVKFTRQEIARWARVIKAAGIKKP